MATAKLNKEKLKRMMEQKDVVPVNLGKKRRGDTTSKPSSDEVTVRPPTKESAPIVQVPATSVEVIEPVEILRPAGSLTSFRLWLWIHHWPCDERSPW